METLKLQAVLRNEDYNIVTFKRRGTYLRDESIVFTAV